MIDSNLILLVQCTASPGFPPGAVVEEAGVLGVKPVIYKFAAFVCLLVLVPQWRIGVDVAAG